MRREAYHYAMSAEPGFANLRSFRRELRYDRADIAQIIINNINAEAKSRLVDKQKPTPWPALWAPRTPRSWSSARVGCKR